MEDKIYSSVSKFAEWAKSPQITKTAVPSHDFRAQNSPNRVYLCLSLDPTGRAQNALLTL